MIAIRYFAIAWAVLALNETSRAQGPERLLDADRKRPDRILQLLKNTAKLQVSVTLDRDVYFPGEEAIATIVI